MTSPRLVDTRHEYIEDTSGQRVVAYRAPVEGARAGLLVSLPAQLSPVQALEIADQLRELVTFIVRGANELAWEMPVREEIIRSVECLRAAHIKVTTLEGAQDLLNFYSYFRDAVADYLRRVPPSR